MQAGEQLIHASTIDQCSRGRIKCTFLELHNDWWLSGVTGLLRAALLDWDNTLRPGFTLTDWVDFLDSRKQFDHVTADEVANLMKSYFRRSASYSEVAESAPRLLCLWPSWTKC